MLEKCRANNTRQLLNGRNYKNHKTFYSKHLFDLIQIYGHEKNN